MKTKKLFHRWSVLFVIIVFIPGCTVFGIRYVEEPDYHVEKTDGPFELRHYPEYLIAETEVRSNYDDASSIAFSRLFDYISGKNKSDSKIQMTAPVLQDTSGDEIQMTAPVLQTSQGERWMMAFVLPAEYTLETAPRPTDPLVQLRRVPAEQVASLRYTGRLSEESIQTHSERLQDWLAANNYPSRSDARSAGYDPPWTLWFLRRNEIHISIE